MAPGKNWSRLVLIIALAGGLTLAVGGSARADHDTADYAIDSPGANPAMDGVDGAAPLSVAIVVETSSRIEALLPAVRRTGILFTQDVLGPDGEATVIGYNDEVDCLLDFTSNDTTIEKAIGNIQTGTEGTHLYDALSQAVVQLRARPSSRRRVIVVLGEAADTGSGGNLDQVIRDAQLAHVTIYSVALSSTSAEVRAPQEQSAPPPATPPGTFAMPPEPGIPQTPTSEALRAGNINLGALAAWTAKHSTAPLRDNPLEIASAATDGLYQSMFRDSSIQPAIDKIGDDVHAL